MKQTLNIYTAMSLVLAVAHNVGAYAVAGLGGLENVAKRNVKPDQLRTVHKPKCFKETNLRIYTSPRY